MTKLPEITDKKAMRSMELAKAIHQRKSEAMRLYRPTPQQEQFHRSEATYRIVRGGNRSGKSLCSFAETACAAMDMPIITRGGEVIHHSYKARKLGVPMIIWTIGLGEKHIGQTIYRMLFSEGNGLWKIRDEHTNEWRAWMPWQEYDQAYEEKRVSAGPYIPPRFIKPRGIAWSKRAQDIFDHVELKNGTKIYAFTSVGKPKQGDPVDLIHVDEDIEYPDHVNEWKGRLPDRSGKFIWSAFPHSANEALMELSEDAEKQARARRKKPTVFEVILKFTDNPFIDEAAKQTVIEQWERAGVAEARNSGQYMTDHVLVYPNFSEQVHCPPPDASQDDPVEKVLRTTGGQIPQDWTRYLAVDPGHTQAAALFLAVPPPTLGDFVVVYDELYPTHADAMQIARLVLPKTEGVPNFESFIIDHSAGRQTQIGAGQKIVQWFTKAFEHYRIACNRTGSAFTYSSRDPDSGIEAVRNDFLRIRRNGTPRLKVLPRCQNLIWEFKRYKKKVSPKEGVREKPVDRNCHLLDCLRYLATHQLDYVKPMPYVKPAIRRFMEGRNRRDYDSIEMGPATAKVKHVWN